jgi:hypothetical protein
MTDEALNELPEENETLWLLVAAPAIWAAHLLLSYATAAVWCAKMAGPDASLWDVRLLVGVYTAIALVAIGAVGWGGLRRHRHGAETAPHDLDSPGDRHRFLGFATLLLAGLSAVATLYVALAAVFIRTCQ